MLSDEDFYVENILIFYPEDVILKAKMLVELLVVVKVHKQLDGYTA